MAASGRRFSTQKQQEEISRGQFLERMSEFGWSAVSAEPDLGEDFLVRVYDAGVETGLDFYAQLKSTRNLAGFRRGSDEYRYPLEVKDVLHWSNLKIPVLLFVWDVTARNGCWADVADLVKDLDARHATWRTQKTVSVRIPTSNLTDNQGLIAIRTRIAELYYPLIMHGKEMVVTARFEFPATPEGIAAKDALEKNINAGDVFEGEAPFLKELRFPDWYERVFGKPDPATAYLKLSPTPSSESFPARLDIVTSTGREASLPYIDLRILKAGSEEITLSNKHQDLLLHIELVMRHGSSLGVVSITTNTRPATVNEVRDILQVMSALAEGGSVRFTHLAQQFHLSADVPAGAIAPPNMEFMRIVNNLCIVQNRTKTALTLREWAVTLKDAEMIEELLTIFEVGRLVDHGTVTLVLQKPGIEALLTQSRAGDQVAFKQVAPNATLRLLETEINLGPSVRFIRGTLGFEVEDPAETLAELNADDFLDVKVNDAQIITEFSNWMNDASALLQQGATPGREPQGSEND